jgi:hypothetical protein
VSRAADARGRPQLLVEIGVFPLLCGAWIIVCVERAVQPPPALAAWAALRAVPLLVAAFACVRSSSWRPV